MTESRTPDRSRAESHLLAQLRELYVAQSEPSYRELSLRANRSPSTINSVLAGGRIASWPVMQDIVEALGGNVDHFRKLFELIRSEHFGLDERADKLESELGLPATQTVHHLSNTVHSEGGTVYIQTGAPAPFTPLSAFAPAELVSLYDSACLAHASGAYTTSLTLVRTLLEAVGVRARGDHDPFAGLDSLRSDEVITPQVFTRAREVYSAASRAVHGTRPARPDDSASALSLALALLSCVYLAG